MEENKEPRIEEKQEFYRPQSQSAAAPVSENTDRYQRYYEDISEENKSKKRRGIGGYIATALVFFIVGVLCGSLFFNDADDVKIGDLPFDISPFISQAPQAQNGEPTPKPVATPLPTARPTPVVDGVSPTISSGTNPIPEIVEQVSRGVIGVTGYKYDEMVKRDVAASMGTGFIFSSEGYIMTCQHIIDSMNSVKVTLEDGSEVDAEIMGADKTMDIAVLKIKADDLKPLKIGDSDSIRVGDFVIAIGDPTGRELSGTTTYGIVSAVSRTVNIDGSSNVYVQTDAAINPGSSGGVLLNMQGEVIGLTSAKTVTASYDEFGNAISAEGLGFATPINQAMLTSIELINQGYIRRAGIGISVITMNEENAKDYEVPAGVVVYSVTKDGPGEKAGLQVNDILLTCNGEKLSDQEEFVAFVKSCKVGEELHVTFWRYGTEKETTVILGDLNEMGDQIVGNKYADFEFDKEQ